ncbi:MAG: Beta-hexosaminidase [Lentisphaerae bacterium ADurb.Bin242]|nr:MAG: Beta-hexosaminidase [Lentisphaerae bacterium ADurb.Bin242]
MSAEYKIRAVQLDLARQMETVFFIREFIDFISENHYNTLFLYLEWRIRTKAFDPGEKEGYSPEELREIIGHAAEKGIDVVPGLATLGHAELLLKQKKFASYSELREGIAGRSGAAGNSHVFCPSLRKTRDFLEAYLTETAAIFERTPFMHVGGDEAWDIGYCSLCRPKARSFEGEQELYLDHFKFIHGVITGKCGKRMMLWDDMFEFYPDALAGLPRDVLLVSWQYQENVSGYQSHFENLRFFDPFALYEKLGFEYLIAPADFSWSNIASFTAYAGRYHPAGALLTSWDKKTSLLYKFFPVTAAAGQLWHGTENAMESAARRLFGINDPLFLSAVAQYAVLVRGNPSIGLDSLLCFSFFGPDPKPSASLQTMREVFSRFAGEVKTETGKRVLEDMRTGCRFKILAERSRIACWKLLKKQPGEALGNIAEEVEVLGKEYARKAARFRRKTDAVPIRRMTGRWLAALHDFEESVRKKGILRCLFALPDGWSAMRTKLILFSDGTPLEVANGCFKHGTDTFFERYFFIPENRTVEVVRLECSGYAGEGLCYLSAVTPEGEFVPSGVLETCGHVEHPELALSPDINFAFLGTRKVREQFLDRAKAAELHGLTLALKPVSRQGKTGS